MNTDDAIDRMLRDWRIALPDLDPAALDVVGRVIVLGRHLERSVEDALAKHDLSLGEFDILATLRRAGTKGGLTPSQMLESVMLSSGGMTARLDKLTEAGLVCRKADGDDRRKVVVELTAKGRKSIDAATATRFAEAAESQPRLSPREMQTMTDLLRRWLVQVEGK
jgi:DNA-binding MarR family transcriptional regulator